MWKFSNLDERQKNCVYRAGFESFLGLTVLFIIQAILKGYGILFFTGAKGTMALIYVGVWYFNVRKAMLDCEVTDKDRKSNRIAMTMVTIAGTIIFALQAVVGAWSVVDRDGDIGLGVIIGIMLISAWIITVIEWIQKNKGYEE